MKILIPTDKPAPSEPIIRFDLRRDSYGMVDLVTLDDNGEIDLYVLGFKQDGSVHRYGGLDEGSFPFPTDDRSRLKFPE